MGFRKCRYLRLQCFLVGAIVGTAAISTNAASDNLDEWGEPSPQAFNFQNDVWEAGVGAGYAFALGPKEIDQTVQNNFLTEYPFPGVSPYATATGDLHDAFVTQAHVYRRTSSWLSMGLEADYQDESVNIPFSGFINGLPELIPDYTWRTHILQITPSLKFGPSMGWFRPYLTVGAGWAFVEQWVFIDDGQFNVGNGTTEDMHDSGYRRDNFLTANGGAGIEFGIPSNWSVGLGVRYNQIFAPNPKGGYMFVVPNAHFDYHF